MVPTGVFGAQHIYFQRIAYHDAVIGSSAGSSQCKIKNAAGMETSAKSEPASTTVAARSGMSSSKVLMPMTFASQIGGMGTPIGTSLNLLVIGSAASLGLEPGGPQGSWFQTFEIRRGAELGPRNRLVVDGHAGRDTIGKNASVLAKARPLTALAAVDSRKSRVVEMRFFGGLSLDETAEALQVSRDTVKRAMMITAAPNAKMLGNAIFPISKTVASPRSASRSFTSAYGATVPSTTTHSTSAHRGAFAPSKGPVSGTSSSAMAQPFSRISRALSRCQSRWAVASRLSCSFLPLARAISSFALPASFR